MAPPPPPQMTNVTAGSGGGSGEVAIRWDMPAPDVDVAFYRLYLDNDGELYQLVEMKAEDVFHNDGRFEIVDAEDYFPSPPWSLPRCYFVTAVSSAGLEGTLSERACGSPRGYD